MQRMKVPIYFSNLIKETCTFFTFFIEEILCVRVKKILSLNFHHTKQNLVINSGGRWIRRIHYANDVFIYNSNKILIKVDLHSVLNGLNHEDSAIK